MKKAFAHRLEIFKKEVIQDIKNYIAKNGTTTLYHTGMASKVVVSLSAIGHILLNNKDVIHRLAFSNVIKIADSLNDLEK